MIYFNIFCQIFIGSICLWSLCSGFNVEDVKVGKVSGATPGSQFGYTVALINDKGWDPTSTRYMDKVLLVGAPNLTVDSIRAHGDVYSCGPTTTITSRCEPLNMKDPTTPSLCSKLKSNRDTRSDCEEDSRMGATLAVNRNFKKHFVNGPSDMPMVTMCAPGWKSVYKEDNEKFEKYMFGMCLKIRNNLDIQKCTADDGFSYCWPFWAGNVPGRTLTNKDGYSVFGYAVGGISATFTRDGSEVIGAPGVNRNRGSYRSWKKDWLYSLDWDTNSTTYYGYSLDYGKFERWSGLLVGNPNFYTDGYGHMGRIELRQGINKKIGIDFTSESVCDLPDSTNRPSAIKKQVGTKFGWSVAAIDITGDNFAEILVGAPLYSDKEVEEGRVYVFTEYKGDLCMIGSLSGVASDYSVRHEVRFGRFGTSIANAGDLDQDGYNDVAIGAPYENGGTGVVYIYRGIGQCDCFMPDVYSQRIVGKTVDPMVLSFGWSLYGDEDIDDNGFPDFAVGAYMSDQAFVFRAKPVVYVSASMVISPDPIPLELTNADCSQDRTNLCMELILVIDFEGSREKDKNHIELRWHLDADTLYKKKENGRSRIVFRNNGQSEMNDTIRLEVKETTEIKLIVDVLEGTRGPEPMDPWTTVQIKGYYELLPTAGDDFTKLNHMLAKSASTNFSAEADFDKKCENVNECTSNLNLTVDINLLSSGQPERVTPNTVLYVDAQDQMEISIDVTNTLNTSYRTFFSAGVGAVLKRIFTQDAEIPAECKYELLKNPSLFNCTAQDKLDVNEEINIKTLFDISRARLVTNMQTLENMQDSINITIKADQENTDVDEDDNSFNISIPIRIKTELDITVDAQISAQVRYIADTESTNTITIHHKYFVTNKGPSFLPKTYVNISVPYKRDGETFARVQTSSLCIERGRQTQDTTTATTVQTTTQSHITIPTPKKERRRREADEQPEEQTDTSANTATEPQPTVRNITCADYECIIFECKLVEMVKGDTQTLDLDIMVAEKEIAREKKITEVRFVTTAKATPPTVWFSGKVVPWDKDEMEYKVTTFLVEPASVGTEVNIWIIIGSVLGAIAIIVIIMIILWKAGFFKRKKQADLKRMRQESLYKRRSQVRSTSMSASKAPYNQVDSAEK